MSEGGVLAVVALAALAAGLLIPARKEVTEEASIHVFTHTVDDREIRCIHFSEYGLSCDWNYGDRLGINRPND